MGSAPVKDFVLFFATSRAAKPGALAASGEAMAPEPFHPPPKDPAAGRLALGKAVVQRLGDPEATEAKRAIRSVSALLLDEELKSEAGGAAASILDAWLADAAARGALPVLFFHGFANSFDDALARAAQIAEFYEGAGVPLAPLVFSWPSDGVVVAPDDILNPVGSAMQQYRFDQEQAWASGAAGARLIGAAVQARRRAGTARLALLAHSMGNHALASALAQLGEAGVAPLKGGIEELLLIAADVPSDALQKGSPLRLALALGRRVTVVINLDPTLSKISRVVNGNSRLGMYGPSELESLEGLAEVVDCYVGLEWSKVPIEETAGGATTWDTVLHQYYRNDRHVRADLAEVLAGRAPSRRRALAPEQRRVIALDGRPRLRFCELLPSRAEPGLMQD
jgi:esterase/lipase superfamily enzyme